MRSVLILLVVVGSVSASLPAPDTVVIYEPFQGDRWGGWLDPNTTHNFFALDSVAANCTFEFEIERTAGELIPTVSIFGTVVNDGDLAADLGASIFIDDNVANLDSFKFLWTPDDDYDGVTVAIGNKQVSDAKSDFYLTAAKVNPIPEPGSFLVWASLLAGTVLVARRRALVSLHSKT